MARRVDWRDMIGTPAPGDPQFLERARPPAPGRGIDPGAADRFPVDRTLAEEWAILAAFRRTEADGGRAAATAAARSVRPDDAGSRR